MGVGWVRGPKSRRSRPESGGGVLGRGSGGAASPSHQLEGLGERCKFRGGAPENFEFYCIGTWKSHQDSVKWCFFAQVFLNECHKFTTTNGANDSLTIIWSQTYKSSTIFKVQATNTSCYYCPVNNIHSNYSLLSNIFVNEIQSLTTMWTQK